LQKGRSLQGIALFQGGETVHANNLKKARVRGGKGPYSVTGKASPREAGHRTKRRKVAVAATVLTWSDFAVRHGLQQ